MNKEQWRIAEVAGLRAEVERLTAERANRYWEGRYRDEAADNERLRAALQVMVNHFKQYEDAECCKRCLAQARIALEPKTFKE